MCRSDGRGSECLLDIEMPHKLTCGAARCVFLVSALTFFSSQLANGLCLLAATV